MVSQQLSAWQIRGQTEDVMEKWLYYALEANVYINIGIIQTNVHFVNGRCGYALIWGPPFSPHSDTDLCLLCAGQNMQQYPKL